MSYKDNELHVIFLPFMAPGHMIPMVDIARILASHGGVKATIITTPTNASRFKNTDEETGHQITFLNVSLPLEEVGLPAGCENLVSAPTREATFKLFRAIGMLKPKLETMLAENKPDCIVSDYLYPWTTDVAQRLKVPRLAFDVSSFFNQCICHSLKKHRPHDKIESETEQFVVSNLPDDILITRSQLHDLLKGETSFSAFFEELEEAVRKSFGVLMNSFYELEPTYADYYKNEMGMRAWQIGPLSLFHKTLEDKLERGGETKVDAHSCLNWLDAKQSHSVLYLCFGSLTRFTKNQTAEIASALQDSDCDFIWVLGKVLRSVEIQEEEWWLPDGFEETMSDKGKGLIIKGWAPQVLILEHESIGGFVTHCGWNSIQEGISAGVPLITWPVFAEQFYNEKLVTQVLKIGVEVGNLVWIASATDESMFIEKGKIIRAINRVMGKGSEGEEIRRRANAFSELAYKAVEVGGSTYNDIKALLQDIRQHISELRSTATEIRTDAEIENAK